MAKKVKLSDLNATEEHNLKEEIDGDKAGYGVIYTGKHYVLAYNPLKDPETYACIGVELFVRGGRDSNIHYPTIGSISVPYKVGGGLLSKLSEKTPFKDRLNDAIKLQTDLIDQRGKEIDDRLARIAQEKIDREKAIQDHINKTRSCQLKIDETIKTLIPSAKSLMEYNHERLLAEAECAETARTWGSDPELNPECNPECNPKRKKDFSSVQFSISYACEQLTQKNRNEKEWVSEKARQCEINDIILSQMCVHNESSPLQPKDIIDGVGAAQNPMGVNEIPSDMFLTKQAHNKNLQPKDFVNVVEKQSEFKILSVEVMSPSDPKYLTNFEKQQVQSDSQIEPATFTVVG
jgi:hypothetical protein